jgi:osmoprotectant transport system permease protein
MIEYFNDHAAEILGLLWAHTYLSVLPVVIGLVIALPLGWVANRYRWIYPPLIGISSLLYTIPSLVLFVSLPGILGTQILDVVNIIVALTIYAVALLVRVVADGLTSVPVDTRQAALAMGYRKAGQLFRIELPLAIPVIAAGVRVATVSNVSLVAVSTLVGTQQLGTLVDAGLSATVDRFSPILISIILTVALALTLDALILLATRLLTPWRRAVRR